MEIVVFVFWATVVAVTLGLIAGIVIRWRALECRHESVQVPQYLVSQAERTKLGAGTWSFWECRKCGRLAAVRKEGSIIKVVREGEP